MIHILLYSFIYVVTAHNSHVVFVAPIFCEHGLPCIYRVLVSRHNLQTVAFSMENLSNFISLLFCKFWKVLNREQKEGEDQTFFDHNWFRWEIWLAPPLNNVIKFVLLILCNEDYGSNPVSLPSPNFKMKNGLAWIWVGKFCAHTKLAQAACSLSLLNPAILNANHPDDTQLL
jgi:hypothetical protein